MPRAARRLCPSSLLLAALAFGAAWVMTDAFDDDFARLVLASAFASWIAVGSGITGFVLLGVEEAPR